MFSRRWRVPRGRVEALGTRHRRMAQGLALVPVVLAMGLFDIGCRPGRSGGATKWAAGRSLRIAGYTEAANKTSQLFLGSLMEILTGAKVEFVQGHSRAHLKALEKAKGGSPPFDVVHLTGMVQNQATRAGLLEPIKKGELGFVQDLENNARVQIAHGPGIQFYTVGLCYNKDALAEAGVPPLTRWSDLWRYKALKGRVAVPDLRHTAGVDFLLAATRQAGATAKSLDGLKKGIAAIKALEPRIVYRSMADVHKGFDAGEVWAAPVYNDSAYEYSVGLNLEFILPEEKGFAHVTSLCIAKNSPNRDLALAYITISLSPAMQVANAVAKFAAPTNEKVYGVLAAHASLTKRFPLGTEDFDKLVVPDWEPVNAVRSELDKVWKDAFPAK